MKGEGKDTDGGRKLEGRAGRGMKGEGKYRYGTEEGEKGIKGDEGNR